MLQYTMTYIEKRISQLLTFDQIRLGKIIEIFQFSFIFTLLAILGAYIMNRYVLSSNINDISHYLLLQIVIEMGIVAIIFFYLRKVALIVPSIAALILPNFKPYTTIEVGIWMVMAVVMLWGMPKLEAKVETLFKQIRE